MNVLVLCEGDAEGRESWSGITKSVLEGLRERGHSVRSADVDLEGLGRWWGALRTFHPDRERWGVRFRLTEPVFRLRSRRAQACLEVSRPDPDLVFQVGATFKPELPDTASYVLYCDSNIMAAVRDLRSGHSPAEQLSEDELSGVIRREASVYDAADAIFTLSDHLRQVFISDFEVPADRVHAVYAGPNFELSRLPPLAELETVRRDAPPTILFVGAQFERKGGDTLLQAFRKVRDEVPDARLLIVGPPEAPTHEAGVECLRYLDKDRPEDWKRLVSAFASAHVFCLPTRFEPFGIAFVEAMFFGLPCVGTRTSAVPEIIDHGHTGYLVSVDAVEELAGRLLDLVRAQEEARDMGRRGYERANEQFTWKAVVERMERVIRMFVAEEGRVAG